MSAQAYSIEMPQEWQSSVVIASPHSGADYPKAFVEQSILDPKRLRSSEDAFVDALFSAAPDLGMPMLTARVPRAFVDFNRSCEELDPALIDGVKRRGQNPRVASGLGVIPRVVSNGRTIYRGKLSLAEARARIENYWQPYHAALQRLLDASRSRFGETILIDCHSMPHEAVEGVAMHRAQRPEIVLGDRFGAAADRKVMDRVEAAFAAAGFRVARNSPFAGAYITQTYGRPSRGQHAIQVEIDRSLYMDEANITPNEQFEAVRGRLTRALRDIADQGSECQPMAAE
ncbi:N-formylglutamate amidohydrolase [Tritonibacter horizontis]|uniref:N-formylglutamate amidohydrolase n=1 Tax=Tritonibacter horizontis TaxID=1768241 RepID=A0A132BYJ5_9RHOB|nr:N-formylglutamate amidohydrolase [Tritonibacter horizontis]KUP92790.1 N-formylglutamate amidohydrolase [Tritonibacter horizontis]